DDARPGVAGRGPDPGWRRAVVAGAAGAGAGDMAVCHRRAAAARALEAARMIPFPKIHDLYVARVVVTTVLLTWAVLTGLDVMISGLLAEVDDIGEGNYGFLTALTYVVYTVPRRAYMMFPTAAVIGTLMGLGVLAASSELTALRALGLSRKRLGASVALPLLLLTVVMISNAETLAPWAQRSADTMKAAAKSSDLIVARYSGLWAREGQTFLNAQGGQERTGEDGSAVV